MQGMESRVVADRGFAHDVSFGREAGLDDAAGLIDAGDKAAARIETLFFGPQQRHVGAACLARIEARADDALRIAVAAEVGIGDDRAQ